MRVKLTVPILALALFAAPAARVSAAKPSLETIGNQVYCLCGGCVAVLNQCPHHRSECSTRAEMEDLIQKELSAGKDETTILQDFVLRYGVQVLSTPPAKGFNLTVWILPIVALVVGLGLVMGITRRWRRPATEVHKAACPSIDPKVMAAMEEEMRRTGIKS